MGTESLQAHAEMVDPSRALERAYLNLRNAEHHLNFCRRKMYWALDQIRAHDGKATRHQHIFPLRVPDDAYYKALTGRKGVLSIAYVHGWFCLAIRARNGALASLRLTRDIAEERGAGRGSELMAALSVAAE